MGLIEFLFYFIHSIIFHALFCIVIYLKCILLFSCTVGIHRMQSLFHLTNRGASCNTTLTVLHAF
uniref:Uncharacterized protein n=1 Tax=Anguilla anguilla TaxID=7936 RepID=A0A0E9XZ34_ANGAN